MEPLPPSPENKSLSPLLREVLVCPKDHSKLDYDETKHTLTCQTCATVYPIHNGIPNMLVDS
ncbi:MAG: Trm112 family protein [Candidatus Diapherotrites archaeon]|nr:Trm112 family protein [Candidatus Diapherotrites archaeon]MDZ4256229.1 Trm112 family protein [archaeon]